MLAFLFIALKIIEIHFEIYYCTIILRDALKLQIPRDKFFIPRGEAPRDEKCPEGFAISMHPEK